MIAPPSAIQASLIAICSITLLLRMVTVNQSKQNSLKCLSINIHHPGFRTSSLGNRTFLMEQPLVKYALSVKRYEKIIASAFRKVMSFQSNPASAV